MANTQPLPFGFSPTAYHTATALTAALAADKWYTLEQAARRLVLSGTADPRAVLADAEARGWLCHEPGTGSVAYDARTWLKGGLPPVPGPVLLAAAEAPPAEPLPLPGTFSYYEGPISNLSPRANVTVIQVHTVVRRPPRTQRELYARTRAAYGSPAYDGLKRRHDYITPAGVFPPGHRRAATVQALSGLLVLDFDKLPNVGAARAALLADRLLASDLVLLFTSPSGVGLKVLAYVGTAEPLAEAFAALSGYLIARHGLTPDPCGKDVPRTCYLSHDPTAYLNPAYAA